MLLCERCSTSVVVRSHPPVDTFIQVIIIDEAAQAVEPSCILPLRYHCGLLVLVGDPQQLPATIMSRLAARLGYSSSLMERLQRAGVECRMLTQQYVDSCCGC